MVIGTVLLQFLYQSRYRPTRAISGLSPLESPFSKNYRFGHLAYGIVIGYNLCVSAG